jgi:hypothetical protein
MNAKNFFKNFLQKIKNFLSKNLKFYESSISIISKKKLEIFSKIYNFIINLTNNQKVSFYYLSLKKEKFEKSQIY